MLVRLPAIALAMMTMLATMETRIRCAKRGLGTSLEKCAAPFSPEVHDSKQVGMFFYIFAIYIISVDCLPYS